jgi:hypothetical protein
VAIVPAISAKATRRPSAKRAAVTSDPDLSLFPSKRTTLEIFPMKMPRLIETPVLVALLFAFASLTAAVSCKTGGGVPPVVSDGVETGIDCAKESISEIAKNNLLHIEENILANDWKNRLTNDALRLGQDVVACLVEYIVTRSRQDAPRASSDVNTRTKIERGEEWIRSSRARFSKTLQ